MIRAGMGGPRECARCPDPIAYGDEISYDEHGRDIHVVCPRDEKEE